MSAAAFIFIVTLYAPTGPITQVWDVAGPEGCGVAAVRVANYANSVGLKFKASCQPWTGSKA